MKLKAWIVTKPVDNVEHGERVEEGLAWPGWKGGKGGRSGSDSRSLVGS